MKFLLVFSLFVSLTTAIPVTDDDDQTEDRSGYEMDPYPELKRAMAALSSSDRNFANRDSIIGARCASTCKNQYVDAMNRDLPNYRGNENWLKGEYDEAKLNKVCTNFNTTKTCHDNCQDSYSKTDNMNQLIISRYMCSTPTFKTNAPCILQAHNDPATKQCETNSNCAQYKENEERYTRNRPSTADRVKDYIKQMCLNIKCSVDCAKASAVLQNCGSNAKRDLLGLAAQSTDFYKYRAASMGFPNSYPVECDSIGA